jgi:flagellar hook-basal body protein
LRQTASPLDFSLDGKGFFLVKKRAGDVSGSSSGSAANQSGASSGSKAEDPFGCLRTGSFHFDKDGVLVNGQGFSPQGWACNADGTTIQEKTLGSVEAVCLPSAAEASATPSEPSPPSFLTESTEAGMYNLHFSKEIYGDDPYSCESSIGVLRDSEGTERKVKVDMVYGNNGAQIVVKIDGSPIGRTYCALDDSGYVMGFGSTPMGSVDGPKLTCSIPNSGATLTFDCSDVRIAVKEENRGSVNGKTITWPGPVYLSSPEEGGDLLGLRTEVGDCGLYLTIFRSEEGYSGVVRAIFNGEDTYRAELILDADGKKVTGYTVTKCPSGHPEEVGTYDGAVLPITANSSTFYLDLSQLQIIDSYWRPSEETAAGGEVRAGAPLTLPTSFSVSDDGVLMASFEDGSVRPLYQLALATCPAPDKMTEKSDGFYVPTADSGDLMVGTSGANGFGTVVSGALEESTTNIAQTLAVMIELQSAYAANTQVIGAISEMLKMLMRV